MALLKTITEVKAVLRISNLDSNSRLPDIESAEETYIIPWIGQALYNTLQTAYDASTLSTIQQALLKKIQKPLAAFAYLDDIGLIHARITDAGIRRTTTDNMPAAYRWEVDEVKNALASRAYQGLESMLEFLEKEQAQFTDWTTSEAYQRRKRFLIRNGYQFTEQFTLFQPLRTYNMLLAIMADVEELYVNQLIGKAYFTEIKGLAAPTTDEKQVIGDLKKGIAHLVIMHAAEKLPVRIGEAGFTVLNSSSGNDSGSAGQQTASDNTLSTLINSCHREGNKYLLKAKAYLDEKASGSVFANYFSSSHYVAPLDPGEQPDDPNARRKIFTL